MKKPTPQQAFKALTAVTTLMNYFKDEAELTGPELRLVMQQLHALHSFAFEISEYQSIADNHTKSQEAEITA